MKLPLNTKHKTMITDKSKYEAMNSKLPQAISFYALLCWCVGFLSVRQLNY